MKLRAQMGAQGWRRGLEAQLGGGPRGSVDHGSDAPAGDVMLLEKVMNEGVQKGVAV